MNPFFSLRSFSMRLLLGFVVLIFLTTLSAGLPAFWLVRRQLEQQAWSQVDNAQLATQSLLLAEQNRLENQLILFTERPTLHWLATSRSPAELQLYIKDFRVQSGLDFIAVCTVEDEFLASDGNSANCSPDDKQGFLLQNGRPLLVMQQVIIDAQTDLPLGTAVAGVWLERPFLERLSAATGAQQSVVSGDGQRLSSTFAAEAMQIGPAGAFQPYKTVKANNQTYFVAYVPLNSTNNLISEVAVPVNQLVMTEQRASVILVASTVAVALLGSLLSVWFVRQMNAPLQKLTNAAEKISQGDLAAPIPLVSSTSAEINTLATALHRSQANILAMFQQHMASLSVSSAAGAEPLTPEQLLARIQAFQANRAKIVSLPGFTLDLSRNEVQHNDETARLTPLEAKLLATLMRHPGQVLTSESLITAVWGQNGGDKTMLKQLVYRLRTKIDPDETTPSPIETISGIGYAFVETAL